MLNSIIKKVLNQETDKNETENEKIKKNEVYDCEICKKSFSCTSSLNLHKRTAKFCIKLKQDIKEEKEEKQSFNCEYCKSEISTKTNLNSHLKICKVKKITIKKNEENLKLIEELKEKYNKEISQIYENSRLEIEDLKLLNKKDKEKYESNISFQKQEYEFKLLSQKETLNKDYEDKITFIKSEMRKKEIMHKEEIMDLIRSNDRSSHELQIRKEEIKELKSTINKYMDIEAKRVDNMF